MYNFILEMILITALAVMLYLMARAIPRVAHTTTPSDERPLGVIDQLIAKLPLEKIDRWIHEAIVKFLHKLKIVTMKMDNYINGKLVAMRAKGDAAQRAVSLKEKMESLDVEKPAPSPLEEKKEN